MADMRKYLTTTRRGEMNRLAEDAVSKSIDQDSPEP